MTIEFHREPRGRYHSTFTRPDGAALRLDGGSYNKLGGDVRVPHDIAHLLCEQAFGLDRGLWGVLAAGGLVQNAAFVGGKKPPHAEKRAWVITDAAKETLQHAEGVVRAVADALVAGDVAGLPRRMASIWEVSISAEGCERLAGQLRNSAARWSQVPEGGTLAMTWRL